MPSNKRQCSDCFHCQGCGEDRCRVCRKEGHSSPPTLKVGFTYGEYLDWKRNKQKKR